MRRVFIVGGTGFLGYHAAQEFLAHGWEVTALGLPPAPPADLYPAAVKIALLPIESASDADLLSLLRGHQALVFAAGMDDRVLSKKPAYPKFHHANVEMPVRLLSLAKQAGVRKAVVLGSYFAHFHRQWPELKLTERHPYIRSRLEQEQAVTSIPGLDVNVLELPYIFGAMPVPGWKPMWKPLVRYLRSGRTIAYMNGGTACVAARTVGRAILGAVERGQPGACYPVGGENLTWAEMLSRLAAADGRRVRIVALPNVLIKVGLLGLWLAHSLQGKEHGLDPRHFTELQTAKTYLDPLPTQDALGFEPADLDEAFWETAAACR